MLEALGIDAGPAILLGRPCYLAGDADPACAPALWTDARYSARVVDSMAAALAAYLRDDPHPGLVFLGHSGGGTLAVLLAARFPQTRAVVTLAGNLDVAGWTRLHGYSPLAASLDPIDAPPLPAQVLQWHLAGRSDAQVPAALAIGYRARHPEAEVEVVDGLDHLCCWLEVWPRVLRRLRARE